MSTLNTGEVTHNGNNNNSNNNDASNGTKKKNTSYNKKQNKHRSNTFIGEAPDGSVLHKIVVTSGQNQSTQLVALEEKLIHYMATEVENPKWAESLRTSVR